jgi:hypothetical protein
LAHRQRHKIRKISKTYVYEKVTRVISKKTLVNEKLTVVVLIKIAPEREGKLVGGL